MWLREKIEPGREVILSLVRSSTGDVSWFESALGHSTRGDRSLLTLEVVPAARAAGDDVTLTTSDAEPFWFGHGRACWEEFDALLRHERTTYELDGFPAAIVGHISYEGGRFCDEALPKGDDIVPPVHWNHVLAAVMMEGDQAFLMARDGNGVSASARIAQWQRSLSLRQSDAQRVEPTSSRDVALLTGPLQTLDASDYDRAISEVLEAIHAGRYYQACLTYPMQVKRPDGSLVDHYLALRDAAPADYGGYFRHGDVELACGSPEEFLQFRGRTVRARPMKGTRRREHGKEVETATSLAIAEKDRAENVMIVDLLRNDLGRSCETGSVVVEKLCEIELYETVLQMTSTIRGTLREDVGIFEAVSSAFPPGSMTGAPKIEACQHLAELEGTPRGLYAGTVGWVGYDDRAVFNVIIRSLQASGGSASWNTGGGIVADSTAAAEWEETQTKATQFFSLLQE